MVSLEKSKNLEATQASSPEVDSSDDDDNETPMNAVWLSLCLILLAGLYGIYLGTAAKSKSKSNEKTTTSFVVPTRVHATSILGRLS